PFSATPPPPSRPGGEPPSEKLIPRPSEPSIDRLLDDLEAQLAAAPMVAGKRPSTSPLCAAVRAGRPRANDNGEVHQIPELTAKLERFANSYGVTVVWLPHCPVEPRQDWAGIYEFSRIRICPHPPAEHFDILLHEVGHLLQDKMFHTGFFDQHEA